MRIELKRIGLFFAFFLGLLGMLAAAHYPVLPESLAGIYRVDREAAITLSAALTLIGFAGVLWLVAAKLHSKRAKRRPAAGSARTLMWLGTWLLATCVLALVANVVVIRTSTRMASAIEAAEERESFDRLARDTLVEVDDDSISIWHRYRVATDFVEIEHPDEMPPEDMLNLAERAPLQDSIFATYVLAIVFLKLGFFVTACALYVLGTARA
jgi:hypothetical protein